MKHLLPTLAFILTIALAAGIVAQTPKDSDDAKATGQKFIFDDVTFPDGTTGSILASMKTTRQNTRAVATYFDANDGYMGQYREVDGFASTDADEVRQWALEHYGDRK